MRVRLAGLAVIACLSATGCEDSSDGMPGAPSDPPGTVRIVFSGPTARRTDLPASARACVNGVGQTHIHPSWRGFAGIPMEPVPPSRYEIRFTDVPVNTRVTFRVNDQNSCDQNPTGAVTQNIFANDVRLVQNTTTPGNGDEPGYALIVAANGAISQ